jgi:hypothetical protein
MVEVNTEMFMSRQTECMTNLWSKTYNKPFQIMGNFKSLEQNKIYGFVTMVCQNNKQNSGQYPSSCLLFKTQRFGDWILSLSSSGNYSVGPNQQS